MASQSYLHAAGTKNYAPYEACQLNKMTSESDVWSIGVIIIEVITGEHPFEGITQIETINNISSGKYKPLPNYIQGELRTMLESMISKDYKQRPTVKALLESETMQLVGMIEKSKEQKGSEQENEQMNNKMNELEIKVRSLEVEKEQEKIRANIAEQEKQKELQEKQKAQSEVNRLTTENQQLKSELSKLRPQITSPKEQSKPEPKLQQIQQSENKIIQTNKGDRSTVAFNPVITSGIVRFGGFFQDHSYNSFSMSI
ncbi:MAG: hypothetical protein EZS28_032124 [Streblomastix strix]|uniref:non-specific serine/threonine protein kinase n=1 Tax=Streblomastix strix TaxID=222440 RepID=A0A5J4UPG1_9EUKA|nr:MAG: hypothetical protein EZS28_032124 [Streblomastix strix]